MILFTGWQQPASSNFCPYESNGRSAAEETPGEESLRIRLPSQYALSMKDGVPACGIVRLPFQSDGRMRGHWWCLLRAYTGFCSAIE